MAEERCDGCRFWLEVYEDENEGAGICRRFPPRSLTEPIDGDYAHWSRTGASDWCGEFRAKADAGLTARSVEELGGSVRLTNNLLGHDPPMRTVGELAGCSAEQLLTRPRFTETMLTEARGLLAACGLKLASD